MTLFRINPYISFVESTLFPEFVEYAVFHRLSGELLVSSDKTREFLEVVKRSDGISLGESELRNLGELEAEVRKLALRGFLIPEEYDPLACLTDHYLTRPIQNPAVVYKAKSGDWNLVRTTMDRTVYSPKRDELPTVVEEPLPALTADLFLLADGTKTFREIYSVVRGENSDSLLTDSEFRSAIDFLTTQERQLIKFTSQQNHLADPYSPINIVPRNLYHSNRWHDRALSPKPTDPLVDFHLVGIEDADWEFDLIEPTVNHCFRFPHEALGGLDYGSRFCVSTLTPGVLPLLNQLHELNVLEVGGGRGSFARSFLTRAVEIISTPINYHILDLSPELMSSQRKILGELLIEARHFQQDATSFDLPSHKFELIVSNEVIADFPVGPVERKNVHDGFEWQGEGAPYLEKYELASRDEPDHFLVNIGAFRFIERAWEHLKPGGTFIITEYGAEHRHPVRSFHLNHDEYSIHFNFLARCAEKVGFTTSLLTLKEFLGINDETLVLNGREEHILCLNHVFKNFGRTLPFAVISKSDFNNQFSEVVEELTLTGHSFSPLNKQYHFGPNIKDFFVLIMNKPL